MATIAVPLYEKGDVEVDLLVQAKVIEESSRSDVSLSLESGVYAAQDGALRTVTERKNAYEDQPVVLVTDFVFVLDPSRGDEE